MSVIWWVMGALLLIVLLAGWIGLYNMFILLKNNVARAWSNIDVLLKQRYDELPKLVEVCRSYMEYEKETLERVIRLRSVIGGASGLEERLKAEGELAGALKTLFAVSENYPQLKANENFEQLRQRISGLENEIADRREFYNESANLYNIKIAQIPDVLVARMMGCKPIPLFETAPEQRESSPLNI
ncbi:MAG: LemA family protein [candidate division TA06 bacterium ADurb.Bin417]|uniref:LemA family protein n=1 Tax=candidate division TA06 bacterium ADurb.Bin417 TaxID=1852828 RepID=A0A1V5MHZ3_UNCT6|nr:MAG: LemA family protein [candidate division TA06 bacterium ADurb.Bin417]